MLGGIVGTMVLGGILGGGGGGGVFGGGGTNAAGMADPFASQRPQYQSQLSALMANPSSVTSTPGYQFNLDQGLQQLTRMGASQGMLGSGNMLQAVTQYGQNYATNQYQTQLNNLMQLAGVNAGNPGAAGQIQYNQNQANAQGAGILGATMGQLAFAGLSGGGGSGSGMLMYA